MGSWTEDIKPKLSLGGGSIPQMEAWACKKSGAWQAHFENSYVLLPACALFPPP